MTYSEAVKIINEKCVLTHQEVLTYLYNKAKSGVLTVDDVAGVISFLVLDLEKADSFLRKDSTRDLTKTAPSLFQLGEIINMWMTAKYQVGC